MAGEILYAGLSDCPENVMMILEKFFTKSAVFP